MEIETAVYNEDQDGWRDRAAQGWLRLSVRFVLILVAGGWLYLQIFPYPPTPQAALDKIEAAINSPHQ